MLDCLDAAALPVDRTALIGAAAHLPGWLVDEIAEWITSLELRGHRFTTVEAAIGAALAEL